MLFSSASVARLVLVIAAALALAPAAGAWMRLTPDVLPNSVKPGLLLLENASELVAYDNPSGSVSVIRQPAAEVTVVSGWPAVGKPALVRRPDGTLLLYFPGSSPDSKLQGVVLSRSTDNGASWSAPVQTGSRDLADVESAALRPDGTPLFSQDGTGFLDVYQGELGESVHNLFPSCCGYVETLAVDATGLAQIAFWSNASSQPGYLFAPLDASGGAAASFITVLGGQTVSRTDRVPLAADRLGNTFLAYAPGYPTATSLRVRRFRNGHPAAGAFATTEPFAGGDPHLALAVDSANRLWVAWTQAGTLYARRSRSSGASFGAAVRVPLPAGRTAYQLDALAPPSALDVYLNLGAPGAQSALFTQRIFPGLTVGIEKVPVSARGKTAYAARVADDGFPVAGAKLSGGGRQAHTGADGRAPLAGFAHGTLVKVEAAGYTATSFRAP